MITDPNDNAFPHTLPNGNYEHGLTKHEYFAAMAMQGLLSNYTQSERTYANDNYPYVHELAVECADLLIDALNKNA